MFDTIQLKALELVNRLVDALYNDERGQTTAEYVAVTAVGVGLALTILWVLLSDALTAAIGEISGQIDSFIPFSGS